MPNERDDASTQKIELQLPAGFASASYEPVPGWTVEVTKEKLATPIKTDDGEITEGVKTITWTADSEKDAIPPGAFQDFGLSVQIPGKAGDTLTFKALQTYTGGDVVRWIGAEGSENPAPTVAVTDEAAGEHGMTASDAGRDRHHGTGRSDGFLRGWRLFERARDRRADRGSARVDRRVAALANRRRTRSMA